MRCLNEKTPRSTLSGGSCACARSHDGSLFVDSLFRRNPARRCVTSLAHAGLGAASGPGGMYQRARSRETFLLQGSSRAQGAKPQPSQVRQPVLMCAFSCLRSCVLSWVDICKYQSLRSADAHFKGRWVHLGCNRVKYKFWAWPQNLQSEKRSKTKATRGFSRVFIRVQCATPPWQALSLR